MRESSIGLPYHRPKQRSLAEFLDRKKGQPQIVDSIKGRFDSSAEQKLQEREKALKEFYKPESEEEEEVEKDVEEKEEDHKKTEGEEKVEKEDEVKEDEVKEDGAEVEAKTNSSEIPDIIEDSGILSGPGTSDESKPVTDTEASNTNSPVEDMEQEEAEATPLVNEETLKLVLEDTQVEDIVAVKELGKAEDEKVPEKDEIVLEKDEKVLEMDENVPEKLEEVLEKVEEAGFDVEVLEKGEEEMDDTVEEDEDSLKLVLEPDTPVLEEEEVN